MAQKSFLCWVLAGMFLSEVEIYASLFTLLLFSQDWSHTTESAFNFFIELKIKLLNAFNSIKDKNMQDICLLGLITCINFRG
jgi:hypothetical protein